MDVVHHDKGVQYHSDSLSRQQLADAGQEQLVFLLKASKALLDAYSSIQPTTESQQRLQELQQQYLQVSHDVRQTLQHCHELEQQEAAASAAAAAAGPGVQDDDPQQLQQLEARAAELRQQLERTNQLVKQVIDKLRQMVDAFNMWDSHERHLIQNSVQFAVAGSGQL